MTRQQSTKSKFEIETRIQKAEVEAREKEFWHDHKDFESAWARNVLHNLAEFLPFVFKFDAVRHGLKQLYVRSGAQFPPDFDWQKDWSEADECLLSAGFSPLPIYRLFLALRAYAYYGLKLEIDKPLIQNVDEFFTVLKTWSLFPLDWGRDEEMTQTIAAALARQKLDERSADGLTPDELAALARVNRKSVMNLLAPKNGSLEVDSQGRITSESALRWLLRRPDFRRSVWEQQGEDTATRIPQMDSQLPVDPIFVPIGTDEEWFSPSHRQFNKRDECYYYYVASGEHEEPPQKDYWVALDFLTRAPSPRWRYSDGVGRWRMKNTTGWIRKSRREIESQLQEGHEPSKKLKEEIEGEK
jgi:hypothetical protein